MSRHIDHCSSLINMPVSKTGAAGRLASIEAVAYLLHDVLFYVQKTLPHSMAACLIVSGASYAVCRLISTRPFDNIWLPFIFYMACTPANMQLSAAS